MAKTVQSFLVPEEGISSFFSDADISSKSPDLNLIDCAIWSAVKAACNKHKVVQNFQELKNGGILIRDWNRPPESLIRNSVDSWLGQVNRVESASGGEID